MGSVVYFNESFFKKWNQESAYLLGLYFTDGDLFDNLSKSKTIPFCTRLYSNDKIFLERILSLMKGTAKIGHIKSSVYKKTEGDKGIKRGELFFFHMGKPELVNDLIKLGMRKDKSEINFPPIPDSYKRHFIRGLFDGNGSFYLEKEIHLRAQLGHSSKQLIMSVQEELTKAGVAELKIYTNKASKKPTYFIKYNRMEDLNKLFHYLYDKSDSFCRKEEPYELFKSKVLSLNHSKLFEQLETENKNE